MKVFCAAFLYLQLVFVIFRQKVIGKQAACKMLLKLTTGFDTVNDTVILHLKWDRKMS